MPLVRIMILLALVAATFGVERPISATASGSDGLTMRTTSAATPTGWSKKDRDRPPPGQDKRSKDPEPIPAEPDPLEPDPPTDPDSSPFGQRFHFGVTTGGVGVPGEFDQLADLAGERASLILWYVGFGEEVRTVDLDTISEAGGTPILTWEPYDWRQGTEQPAYRLSSIIDGTHDAYLLRSARTLRDWQQPVHLRFAHEMNGNWYPWSEAINDNRAGEYVRAYRHIHALFAREGVTNVSWMWSPNVEFDGSLPLAGLYPGDDYVDSIGVDGYNWGTTQTWTTWQTPAQVFDATLATIRQLAPGKPIVLSEVASTEIGGDKAAWNTSFFAWAARQPDLHGFVWFHLDKETDWRIDSSEASARAFADGLQELRRTRP